MLPLVLSCSSSAVEGVKTACWDGRPITATPVLHQLRCLWLQVTKIPQSIDLNIRNSLIHITGSPEAFSKQGFRGLTHVIMDPASFHLSTLPWPMSWLRDQADNRMHAAAPGVTYRHSKAQWQKGGCLSTESLTQKPSSTVVTLETGSLDHTLTNQFLAGE